ncbi:ABC transporter ATP-binding protein [Corynebacterium uterequi]|uniref:ABC-type multidrug transport system, ATPase and permease component n=1 Tax=Corynebacterium uterequi TaxID=1072256 RepID=A0A0G3HIQ7_9CORY|nr:ABC transporter ATP-binding protein [Corynebacterium uterequi]AKK11047.1 ABC-type multidrug transport system, ATPase and permease component [Corynebacterium uterequi]
MSSQRFPVATFAEVRRTVSEILRRHRHARVITTAAVVLMSVGALLNVAVPLQLGWLVDTVAAGAEEAVGRIAVGLIAAAAGAAVASAIGFYVLSRLSERVIADLREEMVGTALGLPVHRVEEAGTGDLVSRATDDVAEVSTAITETLPALAAAAFTLSATGVALVGLQWQFLIIPAVTAPLYVLMGRAYLRRAPVRYAAERAAMADRARQVLEAIHGRHTIRAFAMEDATRRKVAASSQAVVDHGLSARRTMIALQCQVTGVDFVNVTLGLGVGYVCVARGDLSVGAATAAMFMLLRLRGPVAQIMRVLDSFQSGYASLTRIVGVIAHPPKAQPDSGAPAARGEVAVTDATLSYGDVVAVDGVSLNIPVGGSVALVGASGAGKSSLAALLAGWRLPDSGHVRVDGVNVSEFSDEERVGRIAMVSQEVHVFSGTLRDDLLLAAPSATDSELLDALDAVGAGWARELPKGLDTVVGSRGRQLVPVQAQQLALARMLLLDPAFVILDEATAESGSASAGCLEHAADVVTAGRTALIVAHRLDQAEAADRVVVMEDGRIVEHGPHRELVAAGGRYSEMWRAWSAGR